MNATRSCILVLGMHRSGIGAITGVLHLLGAPAPNTLIPTDKGNAAGYWKSPAFMKANDALLAASGSSWDDWTRFDEPALRPDDLATFEGQIAKTIKAEFGDAPLIVLKDPRIARFAPIYLRVLRAQGVDVRCLHMARNPIEVAQSLAHRDGFETAFSALLWLRHTLDAEHATRSCNRIFVTYQDLLSRSDVIIERLARWGADIGLAPDRKAWNAASAHIQTGLRHFEGEEGLLADTGEAQTRLVAMTYKALTSLASDPMHPKALDVLDDCRTQLNLSSDLCGAAFRSFQVAARAHAARLAAGQSEFEELHRTQGAELFEVKREKETLHSIYAARLEVAQNEKERQRKTHVAKLVETQRKKETYAAKLSATQDENDALRIAMTRLLRSPLVPLGNRLRYESALKLSRLLGKVNPNLSQKYERSAQKRDPRRFMMSAARVISNSESTLPGSQARVDRDPMPTVLLPFATSLTHARPESCIAVVLHVYYLDQAKWFRDALQVLPMPFSLFVSTDTDEKAGILREMFAKGPANRTEVRVVPNRGRDIAPKLLGFADIYESQDLVLFLHTNASLQNESLNVSRDDQIMALLGSCQTVDSTLEAFAVAPELGMVAPPNLVTIRDDMDWGDSYNNAQELAGRMGVQLFPDSPLDFPAGSMFWARPAAIQPLLDANIRLNDFPEEAGQTDGTFAHGVERLFFYACELAGLRWIHAGQADQIPPTDKPLEIQSQLDLEWALSDQMPALLLPGTRPRTKQFASPEARLREAKEEFRAHCMHDLTRFLASDDRLIFEPSGDTPKLSIILILYNQAELTFHCLQSLQRNAGLPVEIVILDNGSSDDTSALLDRLDGVKIVRSGENLHFLRGVNRAAQEAQGEYLLLLNNDVRVLSGTIPAAINRLDEDDGIGAVGGPIIMLDGTLQEAGSIIFNNGACHGYGRGRDPGEAEFRFRRDVDYCSGAFLMMRRALWEKLDGFDEAFAPAYYEETDLCMRIWQTGRRVVYDPDVKIVHFEFGSSKTSDAVIALHKKNCDIFRRKHATLLAARHLPITTPAVRARQRRDSAPRLLVIDDRVPLPHLGSEYPRAARMLSEIGAAGWSATLYPTVIPYFSCEQAYQVIPATTELTLGAPIIPLVNFLRDRMGCFDAILVSRAHNMARFRDAVAQVPDWKHVPVLYDAEAIFVERDAALAQLNSKKLSNRDRALKEELALAKGARTVFSVSGAEASAFRAHGSADVRVLNHALSPRPVGGGPEGRRNMLFAGALDDDHSPNTDSLKWFVGTIMPRIDAEIGTDWQLHVVGRVGSPAVRALESSRVNILGKVADPGPLYAQARLFIAPTRYAAGVPMKVHEAASFGLPTVATDLLARQLGWTHAQELMSAGSAESFAACCAALYQDNALWAHLRAGALDAIRRDCAPGAFGYTLRTALRQSLS